MSRFGKRFELDRRWFTLLVSIDHSCLGRDSLASIIINFRRELILNSNWKLEVYVASYARRARQETFEFGKINRLLPD